jgi:hypothetical protein
MHKKDFGKLGEALVLAQCIEHGCSVFVEYGDNSKIDIIAIPDTGTVNRIQVKTISRTKNPAVTSVPLYKTGPNGYLYRYQSSDFDWLAIVDLSKKEVAWIPSSICDTSTASIALRHVAPLRNGGTKPNYWDDFTTCPFTGSDVSLKLVTPEETQSRGTRVGVRERNDPLIAKVINSGIDFSQRGWVRQVALLLNKRDSKISAWMKKYMPEFYEKNCCR